MYTVLDRWRDEVVGHERSPCECPVALDHLFWMQRIRRVDKFCPQVHGGVQRYYPSNELKIPQRPYVSASFAKILAKQQANFLLK